MKSELVLTVIIFLLLFLKVGTEIKNERLLPVVQLLLLANFISGFFFNKSGTLFDGAYATSELITFQKSILSLGAYLISLLFTDWLKKTEHMPEFFILMLSALLGMFFMVSSGSLLLFFLSLELSTLPVAAMANFDLEKRVSGEAAMKMVLSSAFSSGILLFGISLIYGTTGTISFTELPAALDGSSLQVFAFVFLFAAFAFKMSVVPFHLWTADVYEGAPVAAGSFLSVVSKGSVAFIMLTVLNKVFAPMHDIWFSIVVLVSVATMVVGNLFAIRQQNIKRFLAYSSIAQVGFILVGMSNNTAQGMTAVVYFVLVYTFSNLAAFGVAGEISAQTGRERIEDYKGLYQTNPFISWVLALALFSLAGIPPTAGFFGKLFLITAGAAQGYYVFIVIAALNLIVSLYYYLRVIRAVFMDKSDQPLQKINMHPATKLGMIICCGGVVLVGLLSWIYEYIAALQV